MSERPKTSVEIERMTKGPAKVTVRIDADDPHEAAELALAVYQDTIDKIAVIEAIHEQMGS